MDYRVITIKWWVGIHWMKSLKQNGKEFGIFFNVSQKFGEWDVELKNSSKHEGELIMKTQEILRKHGVVDHPELLNDVFDSLSESEKNICLDGLEVIMKYMKYNSQGGLK